MSIIMEMALQSGLFILLLLALRPLIKKRMTALSRYALWAIPAARLIIPASFKSVLGLWQHVPAPQTLLPRGLMTPLLPASPLMPSLPAPETSEVLASTPIVQAWTMPV